MKKTISRSLSLVMAAVMCLSLLPMSALAAETVTYEYTHPNGYVMMTFTNVTNVISDNEPVCDDDVFLTIIHASASVTVTIRLPRKLIDIKSEM